MNIVNDLNIYLFLFNYMITDTIEVDYTLVQLLIKTIKDGNIDQIRNYIDKYGLDVKIIKDTQLDQNCLFFCCLIKDDAVALEAIKLFVDLGVEPFQKDKINQTCLYYAAREQKYECSKFLCERGVPLNDKDIYGQTPLYYAAREGCTRIVELFISYFADVNLEDKYGQIAAFYSTKNGHEETTEYLLKMGSNINKVDKKKTSLYTFALKNNRPNIAELLLKYGASTQPIDSNKLLKKKHKLATDNTVNTQEEESKYKKFVLIKFTDDGKSRLSPEEYKSFTEQYPKIIHLLQSKEELERLENSCDERLKDTEGWEKVCKKVLNSLWKIKDAMIFHKPVDPIEFNIPDYFTIVKNPMDFGTIKKKLNSGIYINFNEFDEDIKLVFYNCLLYNGEKSFVGMMCLKVKTEYEKLYDLYNLELY